MKFGYAAAFAALLLVLLPGSAHAYIDPGTAGLVLQGIIGGIVGALFVARLYWQKLKAVFVPSSSPKESPGETPSNSTRDD